MNFTKLKVGLFLLMAPSIAFAHGVSGELLIAILVVLSTIITSIHGLMILLLRWKSLFRYYWLTVVSYILSFIFLIPIILSIYVFGSEGWDAPISRPDWSLLVLIIVGIVLNLMVIIWTFKAPKKQYRQFSNIQSNTSISDNNVLVIEDLKSK